MLDKRISISIVLILVIFLLAGFAFARDLEVPLPKMGEESAITKTPLLPGYIKYIFNFGIGIAGLIAFGALVYGGFRYLTSAGNPSAMGDANSQIWAGLIGLMVILGSYLLLTTINPQLIVINPQLGSAGLATTTLAGVYLCQDNLGDNCDGPYNLDKDVLSSGFDNKTAFIKFVDSENEKFGAVLHADKYLKGDCEVVLSTGNPNPIGIYKLPSQVSSISVFMKTDQASGAGVTLYDGQDYQEKKWGHIGPYAAEIQYSDINAAKKDFGGETSSVKIEGDYILILYDGKDFSKSCLVLRRNDPNLSNEGFNNHTDSFRVLFGK